MNKIIVSSKYFEKKLNLLKSKMQGDPIRVIGEKNILSFHPCDIQFDCELQNNFDLPLYARSVDRLLKILKLLDDQPIVISFDDSETFNVRIHECIV
jgi:hypothetical protein